MPTLTGPDHFLRFNVTRTAIERREVAIVVGDPGNGSPGATAIPQGFCRVGVHRWTKP